MRTLVWMVGVDLVFYFLATMSERRQRDVWKAWNARGIFEGEVAQARRLRKERDNRFGFIGFVLVQLFCVLSNAVQSDTLLLPVIVWLMVRGLLQLHFKFTSVYGEGTMEPLGDGVRIGAPLAPTQAKGSAELESAVDVPGATTEAPKFWGRK